MFNIILSIQRTLITQYGDIYINRICAWDYFLQKIRERESRWRFR